MRSLLSKKSLNEQKKTKKQNAFYVCIYVACFNKDFKSEWNILFFCILWNCNDLYICFVAYILLNVRVMLLVVVVGGWFFFHSQSSYVLSCSTPTDFDGKTVGPICKSQNMVWQWRSGGSTSSAVQHIKRTYFPLKRNETCYHGSKLIWRRIRTEHI